MPKPQHPRLRLHRDTLRRLGPDPKRLGTDTVQSGDTALCGPSRMETGCDTTIG